jgi:hypothetical protein
MQAADTTNAVPRLRLTGDEVAQNAQPGYNFNVPPLVRGSNYQRNKKEEGKDKEENNKQQPSSLTSPDPNGNDFSYCAPLDSQDQQQQQRIVRTTLTLNVLPWVGSSSPSEVESEEDMSSSFHFPLSGDARSSLRFTSSLRSHLLLLRRRQSRTLRSVRRVHRTLSQSRLKQQQLQQNNVISHKKSNTNNNNNTTTGQRKSLRRMSLCLEHQRPRLESLTTSVPTTTSSKGGKLIKRGSQDDISVTITTTKKTTTETTRSRRGSLGGSVRLKTLGFGSRDIRTSLLSPRSAQELFSLDGQKEKEKKEKTQKKRKKRRKR